MSEQPYQVRNWERNRLQVGDWGPSMTQQSHYDQTDVNAIVARFKRDGYMPPGDVEPQYGDVSELNQSLTDLVIQATATTQIVEEFQANYIPPQPEVTSPPQPEVTSPPAPPEPNPTT